MGLLNARTVAKRTTVFAVCLLLPAIVSLSVAGHDSPFEAFALRWALGAIPFAAAGIFGSNLLTRLWNGKFAAVEPREGDARLIADAAREFAGNKADQKLLERAKVFANNQDGRTVAAYIGLRVDEMRRDRAAKSGDVAVASGPSIKILLPWALVLLLTTSVILVLLPRAWQEGTLGILFGVIIVLSVPIWATAVQVALFGDPGAGRWIGALFAKLKPGPQAAAEQAPAEPKPAPVKLKRPAGRRKGGTWGRDERRSPFRMLLLCALVIAAAMYITRTYLPTEVTSTSFVPGYDEPPADQRPPQPEPPAVEPAPSQADLRSQPDPRTVPPGYRRPQPKAEPEVAVTPEYWRRLPPRGTLVFVDENNLNASGRDIDSIRAVLAANRPRIEEWYQDALQRMPRLSGRVAIEIEIQPYGWVTASRIFDSEIEEDWFHAGLLDRVDALNFGQQGSQPLAIIYAIDF